MKLGRRCPRASPYSVNCETTSAAPFTSSSERFIFPCSSSKMRRFAAFSANDAATAAESSRPTPSKIINPAPISPVTRPSTVTRARLTLCTTARINGSYSCARPRKPRASTAPAQPGQRSLLIRLLLFRRLPRQQFRQLRHIVSKHRQHLRALRQVVPPYMLQPIRLRVMHLVVVGYVLYAPESRHARFVKGHMIRPTLAPQA